MATPRTQPVELHEHAMDNLKYIRQTLERAGSFTAVPGKGGMLMGVVAFVGGMGRSAASQRRRMAGGLDGRRGGRQSQSELAGAASNRGVSRCRCFPGPGRKFIAGFAPAILAGAVLTVVFYRAGISGFLPGVWLLLIRAPWCSPAARHRCASCP